GRLFLDLVAQECPGVFAVHCPAEAEARGSQVSLRHPDGYAIVQALIARGVIGDFRAPDVLRFGFAPLYVSHADIFDAVAHLADIMRTEGWKDPAFSRRAAVT
ncbi:MAG TPA: kynureninase, partial [Azospirillaceae bacterium]|nr:kynureninase [Azospirillaceae bacterium]